ncbi:hypothetical protein QBC40DRAFT_330282 [Triangularia verruculosa]|uniref:MACPF-like domain-containing protein n=1 Tax=Triangularia verruculosa TaxID=2587418 RepID=A0AAN7ATV3_9PEZI|nr:hypothetical protein QBC40DRAFT_330282 [Triangularia verruculosa]
MANEERDPVPGAVADQTPELSPPPDDVAKILNNTGQPILVRFKVKNSSKYGSADRTTLAKLAKAGNLSDLTLKSMRPFVHNLGPKDRFCLEDEMTFVDDNITLETYVKCIKTYNDRMILLTVYLLRDKNRPTEDELQKAAPPKISLDIPDRSESDVTLNKVGDLSGRHKFGSLSTEDYAVTASADEIIHPADMTAAQWGVVMRSNSLLHGFYVDPSRGMFHRAPQAAFQLRKKGADAIPQFHVHDDSSVTVVEITSAEQRSAVENSFKTGDVQASGQVTTPGRRRLAGVSVGAGFDSSSGKGSQQENNVSILRVSYNFPRVALFLDAESLTFTDEYRKMLEEIHEKTGTKQDRLIERFEYLFGHIFPTVAKLGGCLYSERHSTCVSGANTEQKKDNMKIAAGASFSTPYGSGSASASYSAGSNSATESTSAQQFQSLTWQARGGDTLLCSNPMAWVPTVQNRYNWRVIESSHPESMETLFHRINEVDALPLVFPTTIRPRPVPAARSCFNHPTFQESYFFSGARYARIKAVPSPQNDCVTFGPARLVDDWPSLVKVGFDSVDAILPVPGYENQIYVFSGLWYAMITVSPEDNTVVYGPAKIADRWPSLAKAGFDRVDACMPVPGEGRENLAYFFRGENYIKVKVEPGTLHEEVEFGPAKIADHWPTLVKAKFDVVDAILPVPGHDGLAYYFRGNRYARIKIMLDTLKDEIEYGPANIATDWPLLSWDW